MRLGMKSRWGEATAPTPIRLFDEVDSAAAHRPFPADSCWANADGGVSPVWVNQSCAGGYASFGAGEGERVAAW